MGDDLPFFLRPAYWSEKGMRDMKSVMMVLEVPGRCALGEVQSSREWVIPSCLTQIQPVVHEALAELGERTDLDAVELALHEALANAISHGNQESISKAVRLTLAQRNNGSMVLVVKDCGEGFDTNKVPDPLGDGLLKERGRGIFLMRQLVDWVDFVYDRGTEVRLWLTPPDTASKSACCSA
jgi:anti-sigma regulatory factor (Ser/Thr protein kinase)